MSAMRTLTVVACLALVAGCGGSAKTPAKAASFEQALGLDQASINAREAKVQEQVRACMKAKGFDYVPIDPSQGHVMISIGGFNSDSSRDDPTFRRTKGYGITTGFVDAKPAGKANNDPNNAIREALSEADKKAYDTALLGSSADITTGGGGSGMHVVTREAGGKLNGPGGGPSADQGCFGKAQQTVPGGPAKLGDSIQQLQQRIDGDTRLVQTNQRWAACMTKAGFDHFTKPDDIPKYLMDKLQKLSGAPPDGNGNSFAIGGDKMDPVALGALQKEELTIAAIDYDCAQSTGRAKIAKQVTDEAKQRFLDEHPNLTGGS